MSVGFETTAVRMMSSMDETTGLTAERLTVRSPAERATARVVKPRRAAMRNMADGMGCEAGKVSRN